MKRDKHLWALILRWHRDGTRPAELDSYPTEEIAHNSALLVDAGFLQRGDGGGSGVRMAGLTNKGHDFLETVESNGSPAEAKADPQQQLSIFISHSAKDGKLAAALVALLRSALNIPAGKIRCTSMNGYRLEAGAETESRLRQEVHQAKVLIGLITPSRLASAYVMFELGARWGAHLHLVPLLGAGARNEYLRGPLASYNALTCDEAAQVHQLIGDLANHLQVRNATNPAAYQDFAKQGGRNLKNGTANSQSRADE